MSNELSHRKQRFISNSSILSINSAFRGKWPLPKGSNKLTRPKPLGMRPLGCSKLKAAAVMVCLLIAYSLVFTIPAQAQRGISVSTIRPSARRVALVIGNAGYKNSPLRNPVNDARLMASTLRDLGFEVYKGENLSLRNMKKKVWEFGKRLDRGGVGLFYYAGHGVQVDGLNYLIPVGARIDSEYDVELEAFDLRRVLVEMLEAKNRLNLIFLDACRVNPYSRSFRSATTGLAHMKAPSGTLISFATGPGEAAADGDGSHGIFTEELARNITKPGLMVESALKLTRVAVSRRTSGKQIPWDSSSLTGNFYFKPGRSEDSSSVAGRPGESSDDQRKAEIERLLVEAEALFDAGKLTTPKGANALERYNRVLLLQPLNHKADEGLKRIVGKYVAWAKAQFDAGDYVKAEEFLNRAEKVREGDERVLALMNKIMMKRYKEPGKNVGVSTSSLATKPADDSQSKSNKDVREAWGMSMTKSKKPNKPKIEDKNIDNKIYLQWNKAIHERR